MSLVVRFGNHVLAGQKLPRQETLDAPSVSFSAVSGKRYALLMWDPDVPTAIQPGYLHWLALNLRSPKNVVSHESVPYQGPNPPSGIHRYFVGLFEQPNELPPMDIPRPQFDASDFIQKHSLREVARVFMKVAATTV